MTQLMCAALQAPTPPLLVQALNSCMLRFSHCRRLIAETVNKYLDMIGVGGLEEFGDAEDLLEKLSEKIRERLEERGTRPGMRSLEDSVVSRHVTSILLSVLDVVASKLGVRCNA